ncbi:hypothetical protein E8E12_004827 [Didymella heteroderae]|uniref:Uncharacterized protein n=1 Tax=Didymella heteroderae TaxID=1769908 RepID=A0A9P5BZG3_9PLEO|nr:hypothetical protein E8E12_004827 [Didymella heteroderae]
MIQTVDYGREHNFYSEGMARLDTAPSAKYMYVGAAMWLATMITGLVLLLQLAREATSESGPQTGNRRAAPVTHRQPDALQQAWISFEDMLVRRFADDLGNKEREPLLHAEDQTYGTLPPLNTNDRALFLLWIAQWLFWVGFIGLSSKQYCPPKLELLTTVWVGASVGATLVAMAPRSEQARDGKHQMQL